MGNWSCLYHWIEFKSKDDASKAFSRLRNVHEYFKKAQMDRWGVRFGFLDALTIQIVSSQKWGLDSELSYWACQDIWPRTIVQSGLDQESFYLVDGSPGLIVGLFDEMYFNWELSENFKISNRVHSFSTQSIQLNEPFGLNLSHFDENQIHSLGNSSYVIRQIMDEFKNQNQRAKGYAVFGRQLEDRSVFIGQLSLFNDDTIYYETTGCYNTLKHETQAGPYQTPILDEPGWEDMNRET